MSQLIKTLNIFITDNSIIRMGCQIQKSPVLLCRESSNPVIVQCNDCVFSTYRSKFNRIKISPILNQDGK